MKCYNCCQEVSEKKMHPYKFSGKRICNICDRDLSAPGQLSPEKLIYLMIGWEKQGDYKGGYDDYGL